MGLSEAKVGATVAVSDMERAKEFYEGKLGLTGGSDQGDGGRTYTCGGGTSIHVFPGAGAGKSDSTLAGFEVDDIEATIDELTNNGVSFEQYGEPFNTDERGIARFDEGGGGTAWTKDPDGNILAIYSS